MIERIAFPIVTVLVTLLAASGHAAEAERLLVYKVEHIEADEAPTIDGKLDDTVWSDKPAISTLRIFYGKGVGEFARQPSEFILVADDETLYIGARFHESMMSKIRKDPSKQPFWNDCIELYFDPKHDGNQSIQLVVDCLGQRMWERKVNEGFGWYTDTAWTMLADWRTEVAHSDKWWSVEIAIGLDSFGIDAAPGKVCGFNACRFRFAEGTELTAWGYGPSNRQKDKSAWGHLLFAEPGKKTKGAGVTMADVRTVYDDLAGRELRVPVAGGFQVFSAEGVARKTFREILRPEVEAARSAADKAARALDKLPDKKPYASLHQALAEARDTLNESAAVLEQNEITLGQFDTAADTLGKLEARFKDLMWKARLATLVRETKDETVRR